MKNAQIFCGKSDLPIKNIYDSIVLSDKKCNGVILSCNAIILRGKVSYYGKFK